MLFQAIIQGAVSRAKLHVNESQTRLQLSSCPNHTYKSFVKSEIYEVKNLVELFFGVPKPMQVDLRYIMLTKVSVQIAGHMLS